MYRRPKFLPAAVAAALALTPAAGCGDDGDGDAAADPTTGVTTGVTGGEGDETTTTAPAAGDADADADAEGGEVTVPDACSLLDAAELAPLVGEVEPKAERETSIDGLEYSQCEWETEDTLVIVAAVEGDTRYRTHTDNLPGDAAEPVEGVGDEAITFPGVSSESRGATGGRTISARVGDITLVVALRLQGETSVDAVLPLAQAAAGRAG